MFRGHNNLTDTQRWPNDVFRGIEKSYVYAYINRLYFIIYDSSNDLVVRRRVLFFRHVSSRPVLGLTLLLPRPQIHLPDWIVWLMHNAVSCWRCSVGFRSDWSIRDSGNAFGLADTVEWFRVLSLLALTPSWWLCFFFYRRCRCVTSIKNNLSSECDDSSESTELKVTLLMTNQY
jgi:hypothetical protein